MNWSWKNISLKIKLVLLLGTLLSISIISIGSLTYLYLNSYLTQSMDQKLQQNSTQIHKLLYTNSRNIYGTQTTETLPSMYYASIIDPKTGTELYIHTSNNTAIKYMDNTDTKNSTPIEKTPSLKIPKLTIEEVKNKNDQPFTIPSTEEKYNWRAVAHVYKNLENKYEIFLVALPLDEQQKILEKFVTIFTIIGILLLTIIIAIAYFSITHTFKPITAIKSTAAEIAAGNLSQRLKIDNKHTELGKLGSSLNAMLSHIEKAFLIKENSENKMRQFINDASHELRTPLVTVRGFAELYRHGALKQTEQINLAMDRIEKESLRMGNLVEDLLHLARLEQPNTLPKTIVNLYNIASDTIIDSQAQGKQNITLKKIDKDTPQYAPILGNEEKIQQIFINIISNAIRYTPLETPIEIATGNINQKLSILEIRDYGPGIPEEHREKIFERFYRADISRDRNTGGSGLGLAIVAAIVKNHHGNIEVLDTQNQQGTTFRISFPYNETPETPNKQIST